MAKFINMRPFMQHLFDEDKSAVQAAEIGEAMLAARSARLTDIAAAMCGSSAASYKRLQRFVKRVDPRPSLWRLFQEEAEFVLADPTEIERPQAWKTPYVGTLKDGKTKGFLVLLLATPYRGRALPCGFITYSSKTIASNQDSRNLNHFRAFQDLKDLLGERPLVLDREFSYLELMTRLAEERVHFVIRLNLGSHAPKFWDGDGQEVALTISPGETVLHPGVWYKGTVRVNLIGVWKKGLAEPLWVMTDLPAHQGLRFYRARTKIEHSFRDLKSLLGMTKVMNKQQGYMEKILALFLLVYAIGVLVGERLRDHLYGEQLAHHQSDAEHARLAGLPPGEPGKKWKRYSGLFVLLKQKWSLSSASKHMILQAALATFVAVLHSPVRTQV